VDGVRRLYYLDPMKLDDSHKSTRTSVCLIWLRRHVGAIRGGDHPGTVGTHPPTILLANYRPVSYSAGLYNLQYRLYISQAYRPTGQLAIQQAAGGLIVPGLA
jgi:hypothetical protein